MKAPPPKAYYRVFEELSAELKVQLDALEEILQKEIPRINKALKRLELNTIHTNAETNITIKQEK